MDSMRLKMNEGKTEFIIIGSSHQIAKCSTTHLKVNNVEVQRSSVIKYLGTHMDEKLSFKEHITAKCRTAAINFQRIKAIWQVLTEQATETLVLATVMSHLDYCNAILCDLPNTDISQLQAIQNMCAKLVKGVTKYTSNEEVLYQLHWLPVQQGIKFKILTLVHKCINCEAPTYLQNLLINHPAARQGLQSQSMVKRLVVPRVHRSTFAARSFSHVGPLWWNQLPNDIKSIESQGQFKKHLKSLLFRECFL